MFERHQHTSSLLAIRPNEPGWSRRRQRAPGPRAGGAGRRRLRRRTPRDVRAPQRERENAGVCGTGGSPRRLARRRGRVRRLRRVVAAPSSSGSSGPSDVARALRRARRAPGRRGALPVQRISRARGLVRRAPALQAGRAGVPRAPRGELFVLAHFTNGGGEVAERRTARST